MENSGSSSLKIASVNIIETDLKIFSSVSNELTIV